MTDRADLIMHPVRIRILRALSGANRTTRKLTALLPDVPQATLYRHLSALVRGGVIEVVDENKVRGTLERVYGLSTGAAHLSAEQLADATADDHERYFTVFVSSLLADFSRYLAGGEIDLAADGVGYQSSVLHLDDAELAEFGEALSALIRPLLSNTPREGRVARQFTTVLMPVDDERT